ncbi:NUDIX hydrolase [Pyrolobus fumarii 1A]|uniref:NUDIX hydrolase n=1 Tax=Pyrolobus fumarii (strain DSM 11204 / 1A) TaxID=694429 RepID=G0EE42_PYRF1|nr:NUDIX hydrolase [Pyrolobus fumarii]AEM37958.1 NUDIX hydrolase [Pyrolobus fumarii 1A]
MEVKVLGERTTCKGIRYSLKALTIEVDGRRFEREVLTHPGAVAILPFLDGDTVVLLRQWRPGCQCWLIEVPAGTMEPGETPDETARRELEEETGYTAERLYKVGEIYPTPGTSTEAIHLYIAEGLKEGKAHPEEDELIEVIRVPLRKAVEMVVNGEIRDAKTVALLLLAWTGKHAVG